MKWISEHIDDTYTTEDLRNIYAFAWIMCILMVLEGTIAVLMGIL